MKTTITTFLIILNILAIKAQSLELQSFSSLGDELTSTTGMTLSSILGEIATEGLENSDLRLTQGFHQVFKIISHANDVDNTFEIILYPNPTTDKITLRSDVGDNNLKVYIFDSNGQQVSSSKYNEKTLSIPFSDYPSGQYFAIIRDEQGKMIDQIPFQKINF